MIDQELLNILVCPEDKTPVRVADEALMARIHAAVAAGTLKNRAGDVVSEPAEGGLLRADGTMLYLVRDGIPIMLIDEAVPTAQLEVSQ